MYFFYFLTVMLYSPTLPFPCCLYSFLSPSLYLSPISFLTFPCFNEAYSYCLSFTSFCNQVVLSLTSSFILPMVTFTLALSLSVHHQIPAIFYISLKLLPCFTLLSIQPPSPLCTLTIVSLFISGYSLTSPEEGYEHPIAQAGIRTRVPRMYSYIDALTTLTTTPRRQ